MSFLKMMLQGDGGAFRAFYFKVMQLDIYLRKRKGKRQSFAMTQQSEKAEHTSGWGLAGCKAESVGATSGQILQPAHVPPVALMRMDTARGWDEI